MSVHRLTPKFLVAAACTAALTLVAGCSESADQEPPALTTVVETETAEDPATAESPAEDSAPTASPSAVEEEETAADVNAQCSDLTGQQAAERWVGQVPTFNGWPWATEYANTEGYDSCLPLSWIVLPIEGGTGSSPYQIMLFNQGQYLGTATSEAYGFSPIIERLDDSMIQVTWRWPKEGESNAAASGRTSAEFRWDDAQNKVIMTGDVPTYGR